MEWYEVKALVLSGGNGTRLRPLTWSSAKQLVPVANKPVLFYVLDAIAQTGIQQVGIVVGDKGDLIREAVGDGSAWGFQVEYIHQPRPLGLAHAVQVARPFLGESPFLMMLGDNLLRMPLRPLVQSFAAGSDDAHLLVSRVEHPERFGVVVVEGERVVKLIEKPAVPPSDLALVGVYLFRHTVHEAIDQLKPSARGELEITDAIQWLVDRGASVRYHQVDGWWKDTGTFESLLEANRFVLDELQGVQHSLLLRSRVYGKVQVGHCCIIENCVLRGPVVIGDVCEIRDCHIGPYVSIGNACRLSSVSISNSIVLHGSCIQLRGKRLDGCVIGANSRVLQVPDTFRLIVGDNSEVVLHARR